MDINFYIWIFVLLGFYAAFNIISVISWRKFTYSWSLCKQTSTRLENAATGDRTRDTRFQIPDANHSTMADSYIWIGTAYLTTIFLENKEATHSRNYKETFKGDIFLWLTFSLL